MRKKSFEAWKSDIVSAYQNKYSYLEFLPIEITRRTQLKIVCPIHGEFRRTAGEILLGKECPTCGKEGRTSSKFVTDRDSKIAKAAAVHNNKYDYSLITDPKIIGYKKHRILCPIHGEFEQIFDDHLRGRGCRKCAIDKSRNSLGSDIAYAESVHGGKYSYEVVPPDSPIRWKEKQKILCPIHGEFEQIWNNHVRGYGCPRCVKKQSSFEILVLEYIRSFYSGEIISSYRPDFMAGKELDLYIPDFNVAIEINGLYWHSEKFRDKWYHFEKWEKCRENGITLLTFYSDDLSELSKRRIIFSKISHALKADVSVFARKCRIEVIGKSTAIEFCTENHLEGFNVPYRNSKYIGLYFGDSLLMAAIYGEFYNQAKKFFEWKLQRLCTKNGYTVVGGVSKISKYILSDVGNFVFQVTLDTGGTIVNRKIERKDVSLRYWWTDGHKRVSRNTSQVGVLNKKEDWIVGDTEDSYMNRNGWYKIYDAGIVSLEG